MIGVGTRYYDEMDEPIDPVVMHRCGVLVLQACNTDGEWSYFDDTESTHSLRRSLFTNGPQHRCPVRP